MKEKVLIFTGGEGSLGRAIYPLLPKDLSIRSLLFDDEAKEERSGNITYYHGNVAKKETLLPLFENLEDKEAYLLHTASYIDIQHTHITKKLEEVNVQGTENLLSLAKEKGVYRSLYVSSVDSFLANSITANEDSPYVTDDNEGGYAYSKAKANEVVKRYRKEGMDIRIVYPCGFFGPGESPKNHLIQLMLDFLNGKLPGVIKAGYTFADTRDIAKGTVAALFAGEENGSYILGGEVHTLKELLELASEAHGKKKKVTLFPKFLAWFSLPFITLHCKIHKRRPLYTAFALRLLTRANVFDDSKARKVLSYSNRPFAETVQETVKEFEKEGLLKK